MNLVRSAFRAGIVTMEKAASASSAQQAVLGAGWPRPEEGLTKRAALSRILATGLLVEEGEASLATA